MIIKRLKKITKIGILIGIKETWGILCNTYLMSYQPYLTLKILIGKRDKSQLILLSLVAVSPMVIYIAARLIWDYWKYGDILQSVGLVFLLTVTLQVVIVLFFIYWLWRVWREQRLV